MPAIIGSLAAHDSGMKGSAIMPSLAAFSIFVLGGAHRSLKTGWKPARFFDGFLHL